jgi:endonuclease YncB( thermonuclease family)
MIRALAAFLILTVTTIATAEEFSGKVVRVADGDTIEVLRDGAPIRIRLQGVDSPETHQPFGTRAKQATSELAFGKTVTDLNPRARHQ